MSRIRTVKPEFFKHEDLFDAEKAEGLPLRIAFVSLWTVADREGRFKWRPRTLKAECLPHDTVDFAAILDALARTGFILKYQIDGEDYGCIPSWKKHQAINMREAQSVLPAPNGDAYAPHVHARETQNDPVEHVPNGINIPDPLRHTVLARDGFKCVRCPATDDLTVDHIFPQSIGGTHAITNLRCLCRKCNSARPVQGHGLIDDLAKDGLTFDDMARMCMHVQTRAEGKGREQEGERKEGSGAGAPPEQLPLGDNPPRPPKPPEPPKPRPVDPVKKSLEEVLSAEVAAGVIDHRRKIKKPLTDYAAQLLAKKFAATGHPDDAARLMIERAWQGFEVAWWEKEQAERNQPRAGPGLPQRPPAPSRNGFHNILAGIENEQLAQRSEFRTVAALTGPDASGDGTPHRGDLLEAGAGSSPRQLRDR